MSSRSIHQNGFQRITTSKLLISNRKLAENKQAQTDGHKYLYKAGFARQCFSGSYYLLPLAQRCIEKLIKLIDSEMQSIGGVKMSMPLLAPAWAWKHSGRWNTIGKELFRLTDRNESEFCLGPTHEEVITNLVAGELYSYKQLPLRLYQLDRKFRDEMRPRFGLIRGREFWMKDMYTFDASPEDAEVTYKAVCEAYERFFSKLNIKTMKVVADPGNIGGSLSHEYHVIAPIGEDTLVHCDRCGQCYSSEALGDGIKERLPNCPNESRSDCELQESKGIEVGHAFNLGTHYSKTFEAAFTDKNSNSSLCQMGCYGIGVSRLLQTIIEYQLMKYNRMKWPVDVAPFTAYVASLNFVKNPSEQFRSRVEQLYDIVDSVFPGDVVMEDRYHIGVTDKLNHIDLIGYPVTVLIGSKAPEGCVEVHIDSPDNTDRVVEMVEERNLKNYLSSFIKSK